MITSGRAITVDINIETTAVCKTHDHNLRRRDLISANTLVTIHLNTFHSDPRIYNTSSVIPFLLFFLSEFRIKWRKWTSETFSKLHTWIFLSSTDVWKLFHTAIFWIIYYRRNMFWIKLPSAIRPLSRGTFYYRRLQRTLTLWHEQLNKTALRMRITFTQSLLFSDAESDWRFTPDTSLGFFTLSACDFFLDLFFLCFAERQLIVCFLVLFEEMSQIWTQLWLNFRNSKMQCDSCRNSSDSSSKKDVHYIILNRF